MKKILVTVLLALFSISVFSQDIIVKNDDSEIQAKVMEVTAEVIKYKKYNDPNSPVLQIGIAEVKMIIYANGEREVFQKAGIVPAAAAAAATDDQDYGDTRKSFKKKKRKQTISETGLLVGISAGLNYGLEKFVFLNSTDPTYDLDFRMAPSAGLNLSYYFSESLSLQSGLFYKGKGSIENMEELVKNESYEDYALEGTGTRTRVYHYVEVPVVFNYGFLVSDRLILELGAGPYIAVGVSGKLKNDYSVRAIDTRDGSVIPGSTVDFKDDIDIEFKNATADEIATSSSIILNPLDYGVNFGFGLRAGKLKINAIFNMGLANIENDGAYIGDYEPDERYNRVSTLMVTYFFTK